MRFLKATMAIILLFTYAWAANLAIADHGANKVHWVVPHEGGPRLHWIPVELYEDYVKIILGRGGLPNAQNLDGLCDHDPNCPDAR